MIPVRESSPPRARGCVLGELASETDRQLSAERDGATSKCRRDGGDRPVAGERELLRQRAQVMEVLRLAVESVIDWDRNTPPGFADSLDPPETGGEESSDAGGWGIV